MVIKRKKVVSMLMCLTMMATLLPNVAFADAIENDEEILYQSEEIKDVDVLKYRIENHINDDFIDGLPTETTETISGNVKMVESAPTIQKLSTVKLANGDIREEYVATSLGTMYTAQGTLFLAAVDYTVSLRFIKSYSTVPYTGAEIYKPLGGEIQITGTNNGFVVTKIRMITGGNNIAYTETAQMVGDMHGTYISDSTVSGSNVSLNSKSIDCPYYFVADNVSGVGTKGKIYAQHGTSTYEGKTIELKYGTLGGDLDR